MKDKILNFLKKWIQPIFIISVLVLIILEFTNLNKEISIEKMSEIFYSIPLYKLILIFIVGFVSIIPMINYDVIFNKMADQEFPKKYLYETSFSINTLNNLIGFGGFINVGLRLQYYGEGKDKKEMMKIIVKTYLFYLVGFSFLAVIGFFYVMFNRNSPISGYWPWLLGGILYFPFVIFISNFRNKSERKFIEDFQINLTITSIFEWIGAIFSFIIIGYIMGAKFNLLEVFSLIVASNIIGMASLIPGGLGSFDLVTMAGLTSLGLEHEFIIAWILLYRLSYYVLPFFLGVFYFLKHSGAKFNENNDGVPLKVTKSLGHDLASLLIYGFGIFLILSATIPEKLDHIRWISKFHPIHQNQIYQFPSVLLGYIFLLVGRGNFSRQKRVFPLTIGLIVITFIYTYLTGFGILVSIYLIIVLALVLLSREELFREQFIYSWENMTIDGLVTLVTIPLYIIVGASNIQGESFLIKARDFLLLPFEKNWLGIVLMISIIVVALAFILRYLQGKKEGLGEAPNFERVDNLLLTYGGEIDSSLIYLEDKEIYWFKNEKMKM